MVETNGTGRIKIFASINQCGRESNYPKLMLYYTNTRKYCGKEANLQVTVVLCCIMSEWGTVSQDMALTEQKSDMVVIYKPAKPTRIHLVELTVRWDTANNFVKKDRKVWKIDGRFDPCWLWCTQPSSRDRMWGSEDAANLEYICNQVWNVDLIVPKFLCSIFQPSKRQIALY